ncbi:MAG TPA: hypothetical protein VGK19_06085 [Capsulimonadaceae bacterium]|jgi:hypothetical protein
MMSLVLGVTDDRVFEWLRFALLRCATRFVFLRKTALLAALGEAGFGVISLKLVLLCAWRYGRPGLGIVAFCAAQRYSFFAQNLGC